MAENNVKTVDINDPRYPKALKKALGYLVKSSGPKKIYYKGNFDKNIFESCLSVVGSRRLTFYGKKATEQLVAQAVASGITIVSGFMYGGDEAAHSSAIKCGGRTIAVMPCGIDLIFPPEQEELYYKILDNNGLIISEYEPGFKPTRYSFVQRDRIVAGLSKAVLVTEAALNSGSLITANYAKKFGRKVFALPGQITSDLSKGTLKLIKEGAEPVADAQDILSFYKVIVSQSPARHNAMALGGKKLDSLEERIINQLKSDPMKADDLARVFAVPASQLGTTLSLLQLKGLITPSNGKYYLN